MYTIHIDEKAVCISNEAAYKAFCREFKEVDAAGGLVRASHASVAGEGTETSPQPASAARTRGDVYLFIRRNGLWDLPKGHREEGEDIETTALREVSEETGLPFRNTDAGEVSFRNPGNGAEAGTKPAGPTLSIDRSQGRDGLLCVTDHCYLRNGIWHLNHTWWYAMKLVPDICALTPQTEEGISEAVWLTPDGIFPKMPDAYSSIRDVVRAAFSEPGRAGRLEPHAALSEHNDAGSR